MGIDFLCDLLFGEKRLGRYGNIQGSPGAICSSSDLPSSLHNNNTLKIYTPFKYY